MQRTLSGVRPTGGGTLACSYGPYPPCHAAKLAVVRANAGDFFVMGSRQNQWQGSLRTKRAWEALNNAWQVAVGYEMIIGGDSEGLMGTPGSVSK
jgi:hypothetical protein